MRGVNPLLWQCTRGAAFVFALCLGPGNLTGNAAPVDAGSKPTELTVPRASAPSLRQMLEVATSTNRADDASRSNVRRLLDSATDASVRTAARPPAVMVPLIANTSGSDEIFANGFDRPCGPLGNSCGTGSDCCSLTCSGNACINASGTLGCRADADICSAPSDCCSGQCDLTGASGGICVPLSNFGPVTCVVDGEPCSASSDCCGQLCASVAGGGMACQAPSGCNVRHDLCAVDAMCCGGGGNVVCSTLPGTNPPEGLCSSPTGCKPDGEVCGGALGSDCCGIPGFSGSCVPDQAGVNRCVSNSTTCMSAGQTCASSADCCSTVPCVPDAGGILRCSATSCVPSAAACTTNADCCSGLQCAIAPGALGGTCN